MLADTFQVVNNGAGDQNDPHVDCNLVSYADEYFFGDLTIRYFDFATSTDHVIPGNGADSLSDASGTRIAFTEANEHLRTYRSVVDLPSLRTASGTTHGTLV